MEASEPVSEGAVEPYNRSATAQISYPDRKEASPTGFSALFAAVQNLFREDAGDEEPSLTQQITPSPSAPKCSMKTYSPVWTCNMSCIATM